MVRCICGTAQDISRILDAVTPRGTDPTASGDARRANAITREPMEISHAAAQRHHGQALWISDILRRIQLPAMWASAVFRSPWRFRASASASRWLSVRAKSCRVRSRTRTACVNRSTSSVKNELAMSAARNAAHESPSQTAIACSTAASRDRELPMLACHEKPPLYAAARRA